MLFNLDTTIRVTYFGKVTQENGAWHKGRSLPYHLVLYCIEGDVRMAIESASYTVGIGGTLLIPKNTFYRPIGEEGCSYFFFQFEAETACGESAETVTALPQQHLEKGFAYAFSGEHTSHAAVPTFIKETRSSVREIFERGATLSPAKYFSHKLLLDNLLRELLIRLSEAEATPQNQRFTKIRDYISAHLNEPLPLSALAARFSLSPAYLARLFKQETGEKPSNYVNRLRVSAAYALLLDTELSVTEIAERIGYESVYYFSRVFKKVMGFPPSSARRHK